MSKYAPLGDFLRRQPVAEVPMTFAEIERVTGTKLPPKAQRHRAWWSNNPSNNVMTKVWLDAGFQSERVDLEARRLVFRRVRHAGAAPGKQRSVAPAHGSHHPLFGALKGFFRVAPGTDLTEPADPDWSKQV